MTNIGNVLNSLMAQEEKRWKWEKTTPEVIFKQTGYNRKNPNYLRVRLAHLSVFNHNNSKVMIYGSCVSQFDSARYLNEDVKKELDEIESQIKTLKEKREKIMKKRYSELEEVKIEDIEKLKTN